MTKELSGMLAYNIENNPILQKYNSLVERADIKMGMCILSPQTIAGILQLHDETIPFELVSIAKSQPELLLLQNMVDPANRCAFDGTSMSLPLYSYGIQKCFQRGLLHSTSME